MPLIKERVENERRETRRDTRRCERRYIRSSSILTRKMEEWYAAPRRAAVSGEYIRDPPFSYPLVSFRPFYRIVLFLSVVLIDFFLFSACDAVFSLSPSSSLSPLSTVSIALLLLHRQFLRFTHTPVVDRIHVSCAFGTPIVSSPLLLLYFSISPSPSLFLSPSLLLFISPLSAHASVRRCCCCCCPTRG